MSHELPDIKNVNGVQFSISSPIDIRKHSVVEITKYETYDKDIPVIKGLFDIRMGVTDRDMVCATCNQKNTCCPGHFGHIELAKPVFNYQEKTHQELGKNLKLFDLERGSKISGSGFPLYTGRGAQLERKLINCMIDHHVNNYDFTEIFPPVLILEESMRTTGQLPKFKEDMYISDLDQLYLAPTAEVPITNIHRDEILSENDLPINYVAYSPCFRRESGSYGKDSRGLLRLHQFNKVEMVKFVKPEESYESLEKLVLQAESILQKLGITYRVIELCTGDLGFSASKCYDIEIWSPGEKQWLEVSSCSNFEAFQSRRGKIRYRSGADKKVRLLHTLNGSGLATPRLMVALLETYQTEQGGIVFSDSAADFIGMKEIK
jgi:seryl-tRNA synthetase